MSNTVNALRSKSQKCGCAVLYVTLLMSFNLPCFGDSPPRISRYAAENLLKTYLKEKGYQSKKLDIELEQNVDRKSKAVFYLYDVYAKTSQRLVTIGFYGINASTGDVWERLMCKRLESAALGSQQTRIRNASALTPSEFSHLHEINPCFDNSFVPPKPE